MRPRQAAAVGGVNLAVIITPFLDMAFQILSFFIMTYHPSALEGHIPGSLAPPTPPHGPTVDAADPTGLSVDPADLVEAVLVRVRTVRPGQVEGNRQEGDPSQVFVKEVQDAGEQLVADADQSLDQALARLEARLRQALGRAPDGATVKIEADGSLRQHHLMRVYDACRRAGFAKVSFVPPPREPRPG